MEPQTNQINQALPEPHDLFLSPPRKIISRGAWIGVLILAIALVCVGVLFALKNKPLLPVDQINSIVVLPSPFEGLEIEAKAAIVYDVVNRKVLYSKNPNLVVPLASLTKIMSAITAADLIPNYTTVTIDREFLDEEGDSGLYAFEKWNFKKLLDFTLAVSSNDGMRAIASVAGAVLSNTTGTSEFETSRDAFVAKMNVKAQSIGLQNTSFRNETGLDVHDGGGGAYGSAEDMAHLLEYTLANYPEILEATTNDTSSISSLSNFNHSAVNTNPYVGFIPGIKASKTGYTVASGGNLVVAFNPELQRPIIITVLGSSYEGRFNDTLTLVDKTLTLINRGE